MATKKPLVKPKSKTAPKAKTSRKQASGLLMRAPKFSKATVVIVSSLVLLVAIVYLFVSRASTERFNALQPVKAGISAGAKLSINYNLASLTGTVRYAKPLGSTTSACTANDPCTIARAISQTTTANSTIVLYGGVYRGEANMQIAGSGRDGLRIIAYPGQTPEIRGSVEASVGSQWVTEGNYRYINYVPRPVQNGGGLNFSDFANMQNLTGDGVGRFPDQVWIGANALKQITNKTTLQDGQFYVDRANNRLYLTGTDAAKSGIETSRPSPAGSTADRDRLFQILSKGVTIEGVKITRFSANANDYGAITVEGTAGNTTLRNVELSHMPYQAVFFASNDNGLLQSVTMSNVGWQTINANQTDNFTMDSVKITATDPFDEFTSSPASGALKTSRTRGTKVQNSYIANNKSHGLWFDQSNINVTVVKNHITDNTDVGLFFEISDGLTLANNYISAAASGSRQPVKLAGSSGLRIVNNTIIGGFDPLGIYIDGRSTPGCPQDATLCKETSPGSDRQGRFASSIGTTMDWMPRIDVMVNNIIAYPKATSFCSGAQTVGLCITLSHPSGALTTLDKVIHKPDPIRNIPQTIISGNVYANGTGNIIRDGVKNYTNVAAWSSALAGSPVLLPGLDANGKSGNSWVNTDGTPTDALVGANASAYKIPVYSGTNAVINQYIPVGTQQYGALSDTVIVPSTPPPVNQAPVGPATLSAVAASTSQISLSWPAATDDAPGVSYVVTRNGNQVYSGAALSYNDTGLTAGTTYQYKVVARDAVGLTSTGAAASAKTVDAPLPPADVTPPSAPANVKASLSFNAARFAYDNNLSWTASSDTGGSGIQGYLVRRNGVDIGTPATAKYTDSGIVANTVYGYEVFARDQAGNLSVPGTARLVGRCFLIWCWAE